MNIKLIGNFKRYVLEFNDNNLTLNYDNKTYKYNLSRDTKAIFGLLGSRFIIIENIVDLFWIKYLISTGVDKSDIEYVTQASTELHPKIHLLSNSQIYDILDDYKFSKEELISKYKLAGYDKVSLVTYRDLVYDLHSKGFTDDRVLIKYKLSGYIVYNFNSNRFEENSEIYVNVLPQDVLNILSIYGYLNKDLELKSKLESDYSKWLENPTNFVMHEL